MIENQPANNFSPLLVEPLFGQAKSSAALPGPLLKPNT
jgi:hypothetical protein